MHVHVPLVGGCLCVCVCVRVPVPPLGVGVCECVCMHVPAVGATVTVDVTPPRAARRGALEDVLVHGQDYHERRKESQHTIHNKNV